VERLRLEDPEGQPKDLARPSGMNATRKAAFMVVSKRERKREEERGTRLKVHPVREARTSREMSIDALHNERAGEKNAKSYV